MTLDEARAQFESLFLLGPQGNYFYAATGEPYVEFVTGGVKAEGERTPLLCASPELAVWHWFKGATDYAMDQCMDYYLDHPDSVFDADRYKRHGFTLYWRVVPELESYDIIGADCVELSKEMRAAMTQTIYKVYSRFLVSNKPQIQPATLPRRVSVQDAGYMRVGAVSER
jgi:hypothetical protein